MPVKLTCDSHVDIRHLGAIQVSGAEFVHPAVAGQHSLEVQIRAVHQTHTRRRIGCGVNHNAIWTNPPEMQKRKGFKNNKRSELRISYFFVHKLLGRNVKIWNKRTGRQNMLSNAKWPMCQTWSIRSLAICGIIFLCRQQAPAGPNRPGPISATTLSVGGTVERGDPPLGDRNSKLWIPDGYQLNCNLRASDNWSFLSGKRTTSKGERGRADMPVVLIFPHFFRGQAGAEEKQKSEDWAQLKHGRQSPHLWFKWRWHWGFWCAANS